jgi:phage terminase large subunit-like protein
MLIDAGLMDEPDAETQTLMIPATGAMELGAVLTWEPPANGSVDLGTVERAVLQLHERLRFESCGYDPWQAVAVAQNLSAQGVPMLALPAMSANLQSMARELLSAFQTGALAIHRDQRLIEDLQSAQLNERSYGFRISFPRTAKGGHGDRAQALLLALLALRNIERVRPQVIEGPLLCWP